MMVHVLLWTAITVVAILLAIEAIAWSRGRSQVTRNQKFYRTAAAGMLEAVLVMIAFRQSIAARGDPILEIAYWGAALVLSFALVAIALLDIRETLITYRERRKEMFRGLLGEERREE
jgi:hypothetical protein